MVPLMKLLRFIAHSCEAVSCHRFIFSAFSNFNYSHDAMFLFVHLFLGTMRFFKRENNDFSLGFKSPSFVWFFRFRKQLQCMCEIQLTLYRHATYSSIALWWILSRCLIPGGKTKINIHSHCLPIFAGITRFTAASVWKKKKKTKHA